MPQPGQWWNWSHFSGWWPRWSGWLQFREPEWWKMFLVRNVCQWGGQWSHRERQERMEQTEGLIAFLYPLVLVLGHCLVGRMVGGWTIVLFLWWFSLFLLYYCMYKCYMHMLWFNSVELTVLYLLYFICNLLSLSGLWGDIYIYILFHTLFCYDLSQVIEYSSLCRKAPFSPYSLQEYSWFTMLH